MFSDDGRRLGQPEAHRAKAVAESGRLGFAADDVASCDVNRLAERKTDRLARDCDLPLGGIPAFDASNGCARPAWKDDDRVAGRYRPAVQPPHGDPRLSLAIDVLDAHSRRCVGRRRRGLQIGQQLDQRGAAVPRHAVRDRDEIVRFACRNWNEAARAQLTRDQQRPALFAHLLEARSIPTDRVHLVNGDYRLTDSQQ